MGDTNPLYQAPLLEYLGKDPKFGLGKNLRKGYQFQAKTQIRPVGAVFFQGFLVGKYGERPFKLYPQGIFKDVTDQLF